MWDRIALDYLMADSSGPFGAVLRTMLRVAAGVYGGGVALRNWFYDYWPRASYRVPIPVISVGNLTVGGTGKTPMTALAASHLQQLGKRVAIVSRGYRRCECQYNDEALQLKRQLPEVPHVQHPNRYRAACQAIDQFGAELILLDDGFQHRRLDRDLDLVLIDALCPFGYGYLLPRGLLREPLSSLRRADLAVVTRADLVSAETRDALWHTIHQWLPGVPRIEVAFQPKALVGHGRRESLSSVRSVAAFSAIGNPQGFLQMLKANGFHIVKFRSFPDHYRFSPSDLDRLAQWASQLPGVEAVLCTEKDLVKCRQDMLGTLPLFAVEIQPEFLCGHETWTAALAYLADLAPTRVRNNS